MPFIGKQQAVGFTTTTKQDLTPDGSTVAFSLNKPAASANDIEVFVGNVRQEPTDAYTVSGTTLTMSAAPASGLNFYVLFKEANQSATVPAAGTSVPGAFNVEDDFTVDTNTFVVDATNNRVGIGESSPSHLLDLQLPAATNGPMIKMSRAAGSYNMFIGVTSDSDMAIYDNSETERLRFMNQGGVSFDGGTNILDDYEEGTWTPTFVGAGGSITIGGYDIQEGLYTKIGNVVYIQGGLRTTSVSGVSSGTYDIAGLPFTVKNPSAGSTGIIFCDAQQDWTNGPRQFTTINNATTMRARQGLAHGASTYTNGNTVDFNTSSGSRNRVYWSGWYLTDD